MDEHDPYAPPDTADLDIGPQEIRRLVLADRFTRLSAVLLNAGIALVAFIPVVALGALLDADQDAIITWLGWPFGLLLIVQAVMLARSGQTIGKRALGIRVSRPDGSQPGLWRAGFLREIVPSLLVSVPHGGPVFGVLNPLFIFGGDRRCLHDHVADTIVVNV